MRAINFKIQTKLAAMLICSVALTVGAVVYLAFVDKKNQIQKLYRISLESASSAKQQLIEERFKQARSTIEIILNRSEILVALNGLSKGDISETQSIANIKQELDGLVFGLKNTIKFYDLSIFSSKRKLLYTTLEVQEKFSRFDSEKSVVSLPDEKGIFGLTVPVKNSSYETVGFATIYLELFPFLASNDALAKFFLIVSDSNYYRIFGKDFSQTILSKDIEKTEFSSLKSEVKGFVESETKILLISKLRIFNWTLISYVENDQLRASVWYGMTKILIFSVILVLSVAIIGIIFFRLLLRVLNGLKHRLELMSQGALPNLIEEFTDDELGDMAKATNDLIVNLNKNAEFTFQVGLGNFDIKFTPLSENDVLGNALLAMRESLKQADLRDESLNWITTGVAEFGQLLRFQDNINNLSEQIVTYISKRVQAVQGSVYVYDSQQNIFKLSFVYAYNRKRLLQTTHFELGQGFVGQCALEKDFIIRKEIPDDYFIINSGILGDSKPKCLVFCPLIDNEVVLGIIELALFHDFRDLDKRFVKEVSSIAARAIYSLQVNETTLRLLEDARTLSRELQSNQEVMRQQAVMMQNTQKQLEVSNLQLEQQYLEVQLTQKRTQLLLENASEIVVIYEPDRKIRYISPSVSKILGYDASQMTDTYDEFNIVAESRHNFVELFNKTLQEPKHTHTTQYRYLKSDATPVWLEATSINLLHDPAIEGIVLNIRDITEKLRAETEERMRSRMQALSENSPDIVARFNLLKEFFYINPAINSIGDFNPQDFFGKRLHEVPINLDLKEKWDELLDKVLKSNTKQEAEVQFSLKGIGEKTVKVKVIPEFDSALRIESILLVSHDVSDIKQRENELQVSTKKIKESINYARRIQQTIIPDYQVFNQYFDDFFILYKPRDVVSGDFPWIFEKEHKVYLAAVDCTGHGVPGALMSLIGYFALNDIVSSYKQISCGEILDRLHEKVIQAMRQDSGSPSNDGMDVALCCYDKISKTLEFAGAHRPLFLVLSSELIEIKGDMAPIGGSHYHKRLPYKNHTFKPLKGDSLYINTDGLSDQFGGEFDKKFGNQKIRDILISSHKNKMEFVGQIIENEFNSWRAGNNQTDDILFIGIKF